MHLRLRSVPVTGIKREGEEKKVFLWVCACVKAREGGGGSERGGAGACSAGIAFARMLRLHDQARGNVQLKQKCSRINSAHPGPRGPLGPLGPPLDPPARQSGAGKHMVDTHTRTFRAER